MIDTRNTPFEAPLRKLARARSALADATPHRSLARASLGAADLAVAVCTALALWASLLAARPLVMAFWTRCIAFWLEALDFPVDHPGSGRDLAWLGRIAVALPPPALLFGALGLTGAAWVLAGRLRPQHLPIKYLVRCLCAALLLSILVFLLSPASFAYSLADHVGDLLLNAYRCLLVFPFMLGIGYYLFHERLAVKLLYSLAIGLYFFLMIPHKVVVHIIVLHFGSLLTMPLLYLCLGSAFDVFSFIALYAWVLSNLPPQRHAM